MLLVVLLVSSFCSVQHHCVLSGLDYWPGLSALSSFLYKTDSNDHLTHFCSTTGIHFLFVFKLRFVFFSLWDMRKSTLVFQMQHKVQAEVFIWPLCLKHANMHFSSNKVLLSQFWSRNKRQLHLQHIINKFKPTYYWILDGDWSEGV